MLHLSFIFVATSFSDQVYVKYHESIQRHAADDDNGDDDDDDDVADDDDDDLMMMVLLMCLTM